MVTSTYCIRKISVVLMTLLVAGSSVVAPCFARERTGPGSGPHSGQWGPGGLGRGGYRIGNRFENNHPRRTEVLSRDNRLNYQLNRNYGNLDGQYGSLKQDQRSIRQQAQADARANGGYITKAQQAQLNQQENQMRQQMRQDLHQ